MRRCTSRKPASPAAAKRAVSARRDEALRIPEPEIDKRAVLKQSELVKGIKGLKTLPAEESFWVKPTALELAEGPGARTSAGQARAAAG